MKSYYYDADLTYELNHLLSILILIRAIILFKIILDFTIYMSPRAYRLRFKKFI